MFSLRQAALSLIAAALLSAPAAAQWFSDLPAQCPVGTVLSSSSTCVKSSAASKPAARRSLPRNAPQAPPPSKTPQGPCPKGAFAMKTEAGVLCFPVSSGDADALKACSGFNASFSGWYRAQVGEYEGLAKRNRDNEAAMARHIDRQKSLERDLRRQVFRARQTGVRKVLTAQWSALSRDIASSQTHLQATQAQNRAQENKWKKEFKGRLKQKLGARPAGCKVAVAG